jgi:hypothetical protein
LISSQLCVADCDTLLEKITTRINSWLSRNLSFAGRLQLISYVLYSVQVYWSSIFILQKQIIKAIEQKFNRFLWNGNDEGNARAKVSWSVLSMTKKEGLGIKKLEEWNRAAMKRHIWSLFAKAGSLWVVWVKENLLRVRAFGKFLSLRFALGVGENC